MNSSAVMPTCRPRGLRKNEEQLERIFVSVLARHRPHFLIAQYLHTDDVFHAHGLFSDEAGDAVAAGDAWLSRRVPGLLASGYGVLVLADHGQHEVIEEDGSVHGKHGSDSDDDCLDGTDVDPLAPLPRGCVRYAGSSSAVDSSERAFTPMACFEGR